MRKAGFHATKSEYVDAPLIDELPMALECEAVSYDPETCRLVGRIVNVSADESVLGQNGNPIRNRKGLRTTLGTVYQSLISIKPVS